MSINATSAEQLASILDDPQEGDSWIRVRRGTLSSFLDEMTNEVKDDASKEVEALQREVTMLWNKIHGYKKDHTNDSLEFATRVADEGESGDVLVRRAKAIRAYLDGALEDQAVEAKEPIKDIWLVDDKDYEKPTSDTYVNSPGNAYLVNKAEPWDGDSTPTDGQKSDRWEGLQGLVGMALGAASACWVGGTGGLVFDSEQAAIILDKVVRDIKELYYTKELY